MHKGKLLCEDKNYTEGRKSFKNRSFIVYLFALIPELAKVNAIAY